jgi:thiamine biosynthesis lipoprotein
VVEVEVADPPSDARERAFDRLEHLLHYLDLNWRSFGPGELGRLNEALMRASSAEVSTPLARLLRRSQQLSVLSGGLFDIRVGPLVRLWGFQDETRTATAPPREADIQRLRTEALVPGNLHENAGHFWSDSPVALDVGSIGKGGALTGAASLLVANGLRNFLVNAGGDIYAVGTHDGRPWRIGVRDPRSPGILGVLTLESGETVSTSGDYERYFVDARRRYHHIIDPRTGYPSTGTAGTTVLCRDAELAHVASTGLMIAGRQGFDVLVRRLGIEVAMLVTTDGEIVMTPAMRDRFIAKRSKM